MGAQLVKEVSTKTNDVAGDGTTTATLLAQAMIHEGLKNLAAGANPIVVKKGMAKAVEAAVAEVKKQAKTVDGSKDIARVGAVSSGDEEIGKLIADAMEKVSADGVITIEESKTAETYSEVVEGMQFDRGYITPYMVTDTGEDGGRPGRPLYPDHRQEDLRHRRHPAHPGAAGPVRQEAADHRRGRGGRGSDHPDRQPSARHPERGVRQGSRLRRPPQGDAAGYRHPDRRHRHQRGGWSGAEDRHHGYAGPRPSGEGHQGEHHHRGRCRRQPRPSRTAWARSATQIATTTSDYDKEKLQERLAKLAGGVAVIKVGAATETEMKEKKLRIEDALNATRAAVEEGVVAGGGTIFVNVIPAVEALLSSVEGDEKTGVRIVAKALEAPIRQIAANAGLDGSVILEKVRTSGKTGYGFDAYKEEYCDMVSAGIIDPAKVTRSALENAASVSAMVLTTESLVADKPEPPAPAAPAGSRHGRHVLKTGRKALI